MPEPENGAPAERDIGQQLQTVQSDLARLRADLGSLTGTVRDAVTEELRRQAGQAGSTARRAAAATQESFGRAPAAAEWVRQQVRERPLAAALVGAGIGALLARLSQKRRR